MRAVLLFSLCLLAAGCASLDMKQGSKPMARREIPPGPGLLTGSQGEFVVFRLEGSQSDKTPASQSGAPAREGESVQ